MVEGYSGNFTYLKQMGNGPALSICQMEPATYCDICNNFLNNAKRQSLICLLIYIAGNFNLDSQGLLKPDILIGNYFFVVAIFRIFIFELRNYYLKSRRL